MNFTNPVLEEKSEEALIGVNITLEAVDKIFEELLNQAITMGERRRGQGVGSTPEQMGDALGGSMRLAVQVDTIQRLRVAIPELIRHGNPGPVARIIEIVP